MEANSHKHTSLCAFKFIFIYANLWRHPLFIYLFIYLKFVITLLLPNTRQIGQLTTGIGDVTIQEVIIRLCIIFNNSAGQLLMN
jgi:hypothetical protein